MGAYSRTCVNNLDLHVDSGTYYARIKLKGNTIRDTGALRKIRSGAVANLKALVRAELIAAVRAVMILPSTHETVTLDLTP
jgi:hypothetical protein